MELNSLTEKLRLLLKKYRYALLILLIGIVLMNLPEGRKNTGGEDTSDANSVQECNLSSQLEELLKEMEGVGKVKVLLTVNRSPVITYQEDVDTSRGEQTENIRKETVIITDSSRKETGLITQKHSETYRGAVVICQGAQKPSVCLNVIDAVSKVTGLSTDRICVLKMN